MVQVENECHFVCECPLYVDLRAKLYNEHIFPVNSSKEEIFKLIMSSKCQVLANFICQAWDRRVLYLYTDGSVEGSV